MPGLRSIREPGAEEQRTPLTRRAHPVPVNPVAELRGLRPIHTQDPSLQPAMKFLGERDKFPWNMGWTRETRLGTPTHIPTAMGWRERGSDVINVNKNDKFYQFAQKDERALPILASILYHENAHVHGADEPTALRRQAEMLGLVKENPMALRAAEIFARIAREGQ